MNKMIITLLGILLPCTMKFLRIIIGPHHFVYIDRKFQSNYPNVNLKCATNNDIFHSPLNPFKSCQHQNLGIVLYWVFLNDITSNVFWIMRI
jgi:hypothetical protein